jgi:erythromycin esterase
MDMFGRVRFLVAVTAFVLAWLPAIADDASQAKREIEAQYARLSAATGAADIDAMRAMHDPEYREVQADGEEHDLDAVISAWQSVLSAITDFSSRFEIETIDAGAGEATVVVREFQSFTSATPFTSKAATRIEATSRDLWTMTDGGWKRRRADVQLVRIWLDGNLISEQKPDPPVTAEERAAIVRDIGARALPLKTVLAGSGADDLAGLDGIIDDARIVSLGEASHGTAEFFQMKHRLLEYLVEKKGFTVFAIEGNWPEAEVADRYIKTGEGDAAAALAAMYFWTWQTLEVRAMLDWMRAYNLRRGDRPALSFTGFDMQTTSVAMQRVLDLLGQIDSTDRKTAEALYDGITKLQTNDTPDSAADISAEDKARLRDNAAAVLALIEAKREAILKVAAAEGYRDARQAARIVMQAVAMFTAAGGGLHERDRAMADNVRWLVEERFPGEKIVLWAHNGHVGTTPQLGEKNQGMHLRDRYGDQMVVVGFASHHGEVRAKRMTEGKFMPGGPAALPLAPPLPTSVESVFHEAGLPRFILDLRRLPDDSALGRWLATPRPHRSFGAVYDPDLPSEFFERTILLQTYDAIIFIAESTAAKPLQ